MIYNKKILAEMTRPDRGKPHYCADCNEYAPLHLCDESFDHQHGTERVLVWRTQCCKEEIERYYP